MNATSAMIAANEKRDLKEARRMWRVVVKDMGGASAFLTFREEPPGGSFIVASGGVPEGYRIATKDNMPGDYELVKAILNDVGVYL